MRCHIHYIAAIALALPGISSANIDFVADYSGDGVSEGFNDPTLGALRKSAFEYSLGIWEGYLGESYSGETITVRAVFDPEGGTANSAVLGFARAETLHFTSFPTFAGAPLANHLNQTDNNGLTNEIRITFNSDVDGSFVLGNHDFYYGTDANPGNNSDFITTALHEIAHGLGFSSDITSDGSLLNSGFSKIYDQFLYDASVGGTALSGMTDAQRLTAITSGDLYWSGANATTANGGDRVELYAPNPYKSGSSVSHLDEDTLGHLTLSPSLNDNIINHEISNIELGMLQDMGWQITAVPEPSTTVLLLSMAAIALTRRQRS